MSDEIADLWDKLRLDIAAKIKESGQVVQAVYPTEHDPPGSQPLMYTIGNYRHGLPELLTGSFLDYSLPRADDLPRFDVAQHEALAASNPLGIKGAGEADVAPATPP